MWGSDLGGAFSQLANPDIVATVRAAPDEPMARLIWLSELPEGTVRVLPVAEQDRLARERRPSARPPQPKLRRISVRTARRFESLAPWIASATSGPAAKDGRPRDSHEQPKPG